MLKSVLMKEKNVCITCRTMYVLTELCMYESQKTSVTELLVLYKNWSSRFLLLVFAKFNYPREAFFSSFSVNLFRRGKPTDMTQEETTNPTRRK